MVTQAEQAVSLRLLVVVAVLRQLAAMVVVLRVAQVAMVKTSQHGWVVVAQSMLLVAVVLVALLQAVRQAQVESQERQAARVTTVLRIVVVAVAEHRTAQAATAAQVSSM